MLALIVTLTNSFIIDKKITLTSGGEFLTLVAILLIIKYYDLNDFAIFYGVIVLFSITNRFIRKQGIRSTNIVSTIFMFTFVVIEIPIYIYQMLLSTGKTERIVEGYISTSIIIVLSMIIVLIIYIITSKMIKYTDEFISTRLTVYNFILLFSIITVNRFISELNVLNDFYYETIILMFLTILIFVVFLYLSMHILQKLNLLLESLSQTNKNSQNEATNAFRKNHNATNLLLTVNHLLKEQEYDMALQYIQNKK
jgi:hypothetical protein